ncbi:unnamed protein product [Citrullus colocynthis]|uniref:Uncharacterized protein n=1 Tax=Citrullus colocynthis TaxID=252529 RepID=A0ABP0YJX1_9ROSI
MKYKAVLFVYWNLLCFVMCENVELKEASRQKQTQANNWRCPHRYERLGEDPTVSLLEGRLKRATSLQTRVLGSGSRKLTSEIIFPEFAQPKQKQSKKANKEGHPLFSFFDFRRKRKSTARPEFARYLEYLKEGGLWDLKANAPVIYFK